MRRRGRLCCPSGAPRRRGFEGEGLWPSPSVAAGQADSAVRPRARRGRPHHRRRRGCPQHTGRRAGRHPVAARCVRRVRVLRLRLGDAVRAAAQHRLQRGRLPRGLRQGRRGVRREGPRRRGPARRRPVDVCRGHHLQGGEGVGRPSVRARRRVRCRRPRSSGAAVRQDRRRHRGRRRRHRGEVGAGQAARRRPHRQRGDRFGVRRSSRRSEAWMSRS